MHELAFADAVRPLPVRVLRLDLRPFSIGHQVLLLQQRNPLLFSEAFFNALPIEEQRAAVIRAVLICCNTWSQNQKPHRWIRLWGWFIRHENFPLAIAEFRNYMGAHAEGFPVDPADDSGDSRVLGQPLHATLIAFLVEHMGKSEDEAMDYPVGLARMFYHAHCERNGSLKIRNQSEADFLAYAEEEDRKEMAALETASEIANRKSQIVNPDGLATPPPDFGEL